VEKIFWYEFQAMENNPDDAEHYFGIVHQDLTPKPAFRSYAALGRARPAGATPPTFSVSPPGVHMATWVKNADTADSSAQKVHALWVTGHDLPVKLVVDGKITAAWNYLGEPLALEMAPDGSYPFIVENAPSYFFGAARITVAHE
jgi:hypothetical protein